MKKNGSSHALLSPGATGWRVRVAGTADSTVPTLDDALKAIPANAHIELSIPCQSVLLERHTLPATDRTELADMLQLQLEKSLPFPVEEMSHGFELLDQEENESTILSIAAHHSQLDMLCAPLREQGRLPERITLEAQRIAAGCAPEETVLALWPEQDRLVAAIICRGKLSWAQPLSGRDEETVLSELPGLLISAELEGVPVDFDNLRLSHECADLEPALARHFQKSVQPLAETASTAGALDLLPPSWQQEANRRSRNEKLKQNLLRAAVVYLVLVAGAFVFLAWHKKQVVNAQNEAAALEPKYAVITQQRARWNTFAAVVEKERYAVAVLHQLWKNWKDDDRVQFTQFEFSPASWTLTGEAADSDAHFGFTQTVKKNADLTSTFDMEFPSYKPIKDGRVSFTVVGKPAGTTSSFKR